MPKLQAAVPAGAPPNALLRVRLPDGNEVNVRVPEGLRPGDEFIFEVSSMGEIRGTTPTFTGHKSTGNNSGGGSSATGNKKGEETSTTTKSSKKSSKNPKKRRSGANSNNDASNNRGDQNSHRHSNDEGAPSFVTGFFHMYNQVYDILSQNNTGPPPPPDARSYSRKNSTGKNKNDGNGDPPPAAAPPPPTPKELRSREVTSTCAPLGTPLGFLDRELASGRDFLTALSVGMFIGTSIVAGFLAGVLWVTPITKDDIPAG